MNRFKEAQNALRKRRNPTRAEFLRRYFGMGKNQYAEGDDLLGISVPTIRSIAKDFYDMSLPDTFMLLESKYHEERLMALFILNTKFERATDTVKKEIYSGYLKRVAKYVNNWDLVDSSAGYIVGPYLFNRPRQVLYKLAKSKNLWERRVAMLSTFYFIRKNDYSDTLKIAQVLLNDKQDLIHKAVGWLLREVGKRSSATETKFLNKFAHKMPRTMLRYAIEKYPEAQRKKYLSIKYEKSLV